MLGKKEFICLFVFVLICTATIVFLHQFTHFSTSENHPLSEYTEVYADMSKTDANTPPETNRRVLSFANYYAIPAGMLSFVFIMMSGLFLFNVLAGSPDYTLIIPSAASALLAANRMAFAEGSLFLPPVPDAILSSKYILLAIFVLIIIYVILNIKKQFIRYFIWLNLAAAAVLVFRYLFGVAFGVFIPEYISAAANDLPDSLLFGYIAYNAVLYLLVVSFVAAYVYHVNNYAQAMTKNQVLGIQNKLIRKNYESMVRNVHHAQTMRHEWKNNIIAMGLMYKQGKTTELGRYIERLSDQLSDFAIFHYSENFTINAIVSNAAEKARENNISFRADISVPEELNISDSDLCSLLINMLDNSIEACRSMPEKKKKFIEFTAGLDKGFLNISCKNSYNGAIVVSDSEQGMFETAKTNKSVHGFGMRQMNVIVKKYCSLLDINYGNGVFRVQTSLKNISPKSNRE